MTHRGPRRLIVAVFSRTRRLSVFCIIIAPVFFVFLLNTLKVRLRQRDFTKSIYGIFEVENYFERVHVGGFIGTVFLIFDDNADAVSFRIPLEKVKFGGHDVADFPGTSDIALVVFVMDQDHGNSLGLQALEYLFDTTEIGWILTFC